MMKIWDINIDDKVYSFVDSIHLNGKNYIAYEDKDSIYVSEYSIDEDNEITFTEIDENTIDTVKEAMGL